MTRAGVPWKIWFAYLGISIAVGVLSSIVYVIAQSIPSLGSSEVGYLVLYFLIAGVTGAIGGVGAGVIVAVVAALAGLLASLGGRVWELIAVGVSALLCSLVAFLLDGLFYNQDGVTALMVVPTGIVSAGLLVLVTWAYRRRRGVVPPVAVVAPLTAPPVAPPTTPPVV